MTPRDGALRSAVILARSPGRRPGPAGISPKNEVPGMARLPEGACQIVVTDISSPPPSGVMRTLRRSRSTERGKSNRTIVVLPEASSSTSCWRLAAARNGAVSPQALRSRSLSRALAWRRLRPAARHCRRAVRRASGCPCRPVQGPPAETGGDFGRADLGVEQCQGVGTDQCRDAIDLLRHPRGLKFDRDRFEVAPALGRIGRRAGFVACCQRQQ